MIQEYIFRKSKKYYPILLQINYLIIFCLIGVLLQPSDLFAGKAWELFREDHELNVYTRKTAEKDEYEFKAVGILHQPADTVDAILMDIPTYCKWIDGCGDTKLLSKNNDSNCEVYLAINAPWPLDNRDIIYRIKRDVTGGEKRMIIQGKALEKANVLTREGYVRVTDAYFYITLEKITDNCTKVIYQSKTDATFNLPACLSKKICGNMVYNSMINLRNLQGNEHYIE